MKSNSLNKSDKIRKLLKMGFPKVTFIIEINNDKDAKPIVRWKNGPEVVDIYRAAYLIGIQHKEFICFKTEIIEESEQYEK